MKLAELHPQFRQGPPDWGDTDEYAKAIVVEFDCPGCIGKPWSHRIFAPFLNRGWGEGPSWSASGSGYHDLTFSDHGSHTRSIRCNGGCRSHFNVTGGAIDFYGDSGHNTYNPPLEERSVTDDTQAAPKAADPTTPAALTEVEVSATRPAGSAPMNVFRYINGHLHQLFEGAGGPPKAVPVPGTAIPPGLVDQVKTAVSSDLAPMITRGVAEAMQAFEARLKALEHPTPMQTPPPPPPSPAPG